MAFQKAYLPTLIRLFNVFYAQSLLWRHMLQCRKRVTCDTGTFVTLCDFEFCNLHQALALHSMNIRILPFFNAYAKL